MAWEMRVTGDLGWDVRKPKAKSNEWEQERIAVILTWQSVSYQARLVPTLIVLPQLPLRLVQLLWLCWNLATLIPHSLFGGYTVCSSLMLTLQCSASTLCSCFMIELMRNGLRLYLSPPLFCFILVSPNHGRLVLTVEVNKKFMFCFRSAIVLRFERGWKNGVKSLLNSILMGFECSTIGSRKYAHGRWT